jgi:hypothetical protein
MGNSCVGLTLGNFFDVSAGDTSEFSDVSPADTSKKLLFLLFW